jgi:hypothetical protein
VLDPFTTSHSTDHPFLLAGLLQTTPLLETMELRIPRRIVRNEEIYMQFLAKVLDFRRASSQATIVVREKLPLKEEHFHPFAQAWLQICLPINTDFAQES